MSIKNWNIILVLALLAALAGGGFVLYQNHMEQQAALAQAALEEKLEQERLEKEKAEALAALRQEFEDFLNGFLKNVATQAREYRQSRKVLMGLVQPADLRASEYIEENYNLGESTVMSLRLQMDKIMGLFEQADQDFATVLEKWPEDKRESMAQNWRETKDKQASLYVAYFASEQELLAAVQELLNFYYQKRDVLKVDIVQDRIVFSDPSDQVAHAALKDKIADLVAIQAEILKD